MKKFKSSICTLYEGEYHYGVAVLINSAYKNGFRGNVYVGFKGELPPWAKNVEHDYDTNWDGCKVFIACSDLKVFFIPLTTHKHLTNYKPDFMLELFGNQRTASENLFYLDPDIVIVAPFEFFEKWVECGVALAEDINSPLQEYHPRRVSWRNYFSKYCLTLNYKNQIYANGGFIGISVSNSEYLEIWKNLQELMSEAIGGLDKSIFGDNPLSKLKGDFDSFSKTDQDAMNAAIEVYNDKVSFIGKEAMAFQNGLFMIPHALGPDKPWIVSPLKMLLEGKKPRFVDKVFWNYALSPIRPFSNKKVKMMKINILVCSFFSRFYSK